LSDGKNESAILRRKRKNKLHVTKYFSMIQRLYFFVDAISGGQQSFKKNIIYDVQRFFGIDRARQLVIRVQY